MTAAKKQKGHWAKGKNRNADVSGWDAVRGRLVRLVEDFPLRNVRSYRAVADAIGSDPKSVWRWAAGLRRPVPSVQRKIDSWTRDQAKAIRRIKR